MFDPQDPMTRDVMCTVCGQPLTGDRDDQPDWPGGPIDGECYRAREFDQTLWEQELMDDDEDA